MNQMILLSMKMVISSSKFKRLYGDYMLKGKCKELFIELRDYSENIMAMQDFIELVKEFTEWNKGKIEITLVNLEDYGFKSQELFVFYNDGTYNFTSVYTTFEFVDIMIETYDCYKDEEYLEDFWVPRLENLIEENEY